MGRKRSMKAKTPEHALVAQRMLKAMEEADLTAREVADRVGVQRQTVYKWLAGYSDPSPTDKDRFAQAVGKPISYFFVGPGEAAEVTEVVMRVMNEVLAGILRGELVGDALAAGLGPYGELPPVHRDLLNRMTDHLRRATPPGGPLAWDDLPETDRQALLEEIRRRQRADGREDTAAASPRSRGRSGAGTG